MNCTAERQRRRTATNRGTERASNREQMTLHRADISETARDANTGRRSDQRAALPESARNKERARLGGEN